MRGVVDGFASAAEIAEMLRLSPPEPQPPAHSSIDSWRWETPAHLPLFASLVARAQPRGPVSRARPTVQPDRNKAAQRRPRG